MTGAEADIAQAALDWLDNRWWGVVGQFTELTSRLSWLHLLSALVLALVAYRLYRPQGAGRTGLRDAIAYILPKSVYLHPSSIVDYKIFLFNLLFRPAGLMLSFLTTGFIGWGVAGLARQLIGPAPVQFEAGPVSMVVLGLLMALAYDLGTYITHRLTHTVPVLWAFHRVHHSAEVLNPVTLFRKHPVYDALGRWIDALVAGPLLGVIVYFWSSDVALKVGTTVAVIFTLFNFVGGNLRHTHIWLSFGPVLGRLLISPAQHQIHHSLAERHWNKNYGEVFAIWDWLFGSLYLPREREELRFGVTDAPAQPHPTLWRAMVEPFLYAWAQLRPGRLPATTADSPPAASTTDRPAS